MDSKLSEYVSEWWELYKVDHEEDDERVEELEREIAICLRQPGGPASCALVDSINNEGAKHKIVLVPVWDSRGWYGVGVYDVVCRVKS